MTQQDGLEEPRSVIAHHWQLRAVCEHFGIVASDEQAAKTIQTLQRRMNGLLGRIEHLAEWMTNHSDQRHAEPPMKHPNKWCFSGMRYRPNSHP